jgi:hypothetical protein
MHRLFRLLRTFCKHRTADAIADYLDERLRTKGYGKQIRAYLDTLGMPAAPSAASVRAAASAPIPKAPKTTKKKPDSGQMSFL